MGGFRVRRDVLLHRAIDHGILPPTARRIAAASGLSPGTVARALRGEAISAATMAALEEVLGNGLLFMADPGADPEILPSWKNLHIRAT